MTAGGDAGPDPEAGSFDLVCLRTVPVPWDCLADQLVCEAVLRRGPSVQRARHCWLTPGQLAHVLKGLSRSPARGPELDLVVAADAAFLTGSRVTAYLLNEHSVHVRAQGARWWIRVADGDEGNVAEALRDVQARSQSDLVPRMMEFIRGLPDFGPVQVSVGPPSMRVALTPEQFGESLFRTACALWAEDARIRERRGAKNEGGLWSARELEARQFYRSQLQEALDGFTTRFALGRLEIPQNDEEAGSGKS